MVNQNTIHDKTYSLYSTVLDKVNQKISKLNLPEFIINYKEYQRWPKRLYKYYYCRQKQTDKTKLQIPTFLREKIQILLTKIYERLLMLGQFGSMLKRKLQKQLQFFCRTLKNSNYTTNYSPSDIDKELLRIIEYHQKKSVNKFKLSVKFQNNVLLAEFQQRLKTYYELERQNLITSDGIDDKSGCINFIVSPLNKQQMHVNRNCLKCTTFFALNTATVVHPAVSYYSVDAYELSSYDSINNIQSNVRASICTMLNQPTGGIVLIGCQREGTLVIPKGFHITQKQKDSLQQKIQNFFLKISPKVKRNEQVFIDFVPVMELKKNNANPNQLYKYEALKGVFICRIFLLPKQNYKIFLLKASSDHSTLEAKKDNESITFPESKNYSFLIQKFDAQYQKRLKFGVNSCHYNIKCSAPHTGGLAFVKKYQQISQTTKSQIDDFKQTQLQNSDNIKKQGRAKQIDFVNKTPDDYKLWTLVVGDKATMNRFMQIANQKQSKGIKFQQMYVESNYKLTKTTWVMFHQDKFEVMKKIAQKHSIQYKNKQLKMIASSLYLQIQQGINYSHYYMLNDLIQNPSVGSKIKALVQKQNQNKKVWIVWFQSLRGSIYAYFYLSDLNYKVKFIRGANHFKDYQPPSQQANTGVGYQNNAYEYYNAYNTNNYYYPQNYTTDVSYQQNYNQNYQTAYQNYGYYQGQKNVNNYYPNQ